MSISPARLFRAYVNRGDIASKEITFVVAAGGGGGEAARGKIKQA